MVQLQIPQPYTYAHIAMIVGDQGSGKSNTGTARNIDNALDAIVAVKRISDGKIFKATPLSHEERNKLKEDGYTLTFDTVKLYLPDGKIHIRPVPENHIIIPSINIFTNFHLFGVRYIFCRSWAQIIDWLDKDIIRNGRLSIDEYHIGGNSRDFMTGLGKALSKYNFTFRKRHLEVDILCVHKRLAEWTTRLAVTENIMCKYDENTKMITYEQKKRGETKFHEHSYYAPTYWKYFDTDEEFKLPEGQVGRAMASAR